ncbi:SpoIID/LytB domain-containing protein [Actinomycetota bacterium]|jgi:SpoIID/LytB domain protein
MRRLTLLLAGITLITILPLSAAHAASDDVVVFDGAGWGHGVGMSQYGAQARALAGQDAETILEAYYTGATIGTLGEAPLPAPGSLFTNVASDITSTVLTILDGPGPGTGIEVVRITGEPEPPTATLSTGDTVTIVDTTPDPGFPDGCEITLSIGGAPTVWDAGTCDVTVALTEGDAEPAHLVRATNCRRPTECTYGYGIAFHTVDNGSDQRLNTDRIGGCTGCPEYQGFDLVVEASVDDYTRGIAEVPFSWHVEALETQAIAARSYAASWAVSTDHRTAGCFCDVRNDSSFQVFAGWIANRTMASRWDDAAVSTAGRIVTHPAAPHSGIVRAFYSSSNGGASEWAKEKWNIDVPYLVSVPDPWSVTPANPLDSWRFSFSPATVAAAIWGSGGSQYQLLDIEVIARNTSGSARTVRFTAATPSDTIITKDVAAGTVASKFGLYSWYFDAFYQAPPPPGPGPEGPSMAAVQDPRTGIWTLRAPDGAEESFYFGNPLDIPFTGDWNGDGIDTPGLYRESAGYLFLRQTNTQGIADIEIYYGNPGDLPVAGDWDGDGDDTVGIYRRSQARFYLRNSNTQGTGDIAIDFGNPNDVPLAGDWDGDGRDGIGVYRPSTKMVYLVNNLNTGTVATSFRYDGAATGDRIVVGDWDGDGDDTVGVFRPSTNTWFLRDTFTQASANIVFEFGRGWMNPVAGYWGD